jgi:hypothetical protein
MASLMVSPVALVDAYAVRPFEELSHGGALLAALRDRVPEAAGGLARPETPTGPAPAASRPEQDLFLGLPPSTRLRCLARYLAFAQESPLGRSVNVLA